MKNALLVRWMRAFSRIFPAQMGVGDFFTRLFSGRLKRQIAAEIADEMLGFMLGLMDIAFALSKGFRKHIEGFQGRYVFATEDNGSGSRVEESVIFKNGDMIRSDDAIEDYHVKVTFEDTDSLRRYMLSTDPDILDLMLENKVTVEGNVNYIYKFLFMTKDLFRRVGIG